MREIKQKIRKTMDEILELQKLLPIWAKMASQINDHYIRNNLKRKGARLEVVKIELKHLIELKADLVSTVPSA